MTESQVESITAAASKSLPGDSKGQRGMWHGAWGTGSQSQGTSLASFAAQVNHNNIKFDFPACDAVGKRTLDADVAVDVGVIEIALIAQKYR